MKPYYESGGITIYHGDCRDVLPTLGTVGGIVTDPPYGMGRFATDGKDFLSVVGPALRIAWARVATPGSMFVFMSTAEVVKPADMTYPLGGWLLTSEAILWFHRGDSLGLVERRPFRHDCYISTRTGREGVEGHPTVKPLDVVQDFVARIPGTVLDPFLGSGTTTRAARNLGKPAIGIEIEERYCEIAARRLDVEATLVTQVRALTADDTCGEEDSRGVSCATFVARLLAPRVAVAILAAEERMAERVDEYGPRLDDLYRAADEVALAALRGSLFADGHSPRAR